jgi:hypothetical protein
LTGSDKKLFFGTANAVSLTEELLNTASVYARVTAEQSNIRQEKDALRKKNKNYPRQFPGWGS